MGRIFLHTGGLLTFCAAVQLAGCTSKTTNAPSQTKPKSAAVQSEAAPADKPVQQAEEDPSVAKALAQLSAEDRAIAVKQVVCPVSGETLGKMGSPVKMEVQGQTVFLCCSGCKDKLLANPDEYLAKLNK